MGLFIAIIAIVALGLVSWIAIPIVLGIFGVRFVRKRLLGKGDDTPARQARIAGMPHVPVAPLRHPGCPHQEAMQLQKMEQRLEEAHGQCLSALDRRLASQLARARVAAPLEDAYAQMRGEIDSIYAFCERNDLSGMLEKARRSPAAQDIYQEAYERDLAKVRAAIDKTEECLRAYERTVATLEVSSIDADISSDFDASIEMLRDLRAELPSYNLEDRV